MVASPLQAPVAAAPAHARGAGTPWIVSRNFDAGYFLLSGLVVFIPLVATRVFSVKPDIILMAVAALANGPHLSSTWSRVYLDSSEFRQRPFAYAGVPLLIASLVVGSIMLTSDAYRILCSVILYWATYHFAAQCYGILRIYQRKSGEGEQSVHRAESALVFALGLSGLLYRLHFGPRRLFDVEAYAPPVPLEAVLFVAAFALGCATCVGIDWVQRLRNGERLPWERLAFLGAVLCGFGVPFVLMSDGTAGFAAAACWHGIQYLGIVFHYNRQKFRGQSPNGAKLIAWASQPGRAVAYGLLMLGLVGTVYAATIILALVARIDLWSLGLATWVTITLSHYWVDGLIWKMRRDRTNRRLLTVEA